MRRSKSESVNDDTTSIDRVSLVGPTEAALIMGWKHRSSFYKHFHEGRLPDIRSVMLLKGRYYVLEDVFIAAFPEASWEQLLEMILTYRDDRRGKIKTIYGSREYLESKIGSPLSRFSQDTWK